MSLTSFHSREGSALLFVLCAIALMSVTVLGLVDFADLDLKEIITRKKDFRATQLAESGIALGSYPKLKTDDPVLKQKFDSTESFSVTFKSEGGKLNINALLLRDEQEVLQNLFGQWGVKLQDQMVIMDCLMDWVDGDPLQRINGAEANFYEAKGLKGYPLNRAFQSLDEMDLVPAVVLLSKAKPDWKEYFTVWSDGTLDLNEASSDLIAARCGVGSAEAERFVNRRLGPDGKSGTQDDFRYPDFTQVRNALGLSEKAFATIQQKVTLQSEYRRIESVGRVGPYERKISVVIHLNAVPVQYLTWNKF